MIKKIILPFVLLLFLSDKSSAQNGSVWDYKERLFVERKQDFYIVEWFHHKVEMSTDTLKFINDSTYVGSKYMLLINDFKMYLKSSDRCKKLKLKTTTSEALKRREVRKEYFLQFSRQKQ